MAFKLPDDLKIKDHEWWNPRVYPTRRLRFAPHDNPISWRMGACMTELIIDMFDHFKRRDLSLIEIGSHIGESSSMFAGSGIFNEIHLIDLWNNAPALSICEYNMRLFPFVEMHQGSSEDINKSWTNKVDVVYIDAGHDYDNIKRDIELWRPFIKSGGILSGHDYFGCFDGVVKAVDELNLPFKRYKEGSWLITI
jgi:hypothetical protein